MCGGFVMPPTAWQTRAVQAELYRGGAALVDAQGVEGYVNALRAAFRARPMPGFDEAMQEKLLASMRAKSAPELARLLRGAAASDLPEPEALRGLDVPALILPVQGDPGHPLSTAERLHELLAGSELHVSRDVTSLGAQRDTIASFLARVA